MVSQKKREGVFGKGDGVTAGGGALSMTMSEVLGEPLSLDAPQETNGASGVGPSAQDAQDSQKDKPQAPAGPSKAVLQRRRAGRGGKWTVRVLLTPRPGPEQIEELARDIRRALGTGARSEDGVLVVQGDIPDRVEEWLKKRGVRKIVR